MLNQFLGTDELIVPLNAGDRYICSQCSLGFVQQNNASHFDSGAMLLNENTGKVYCPICASCHLRFYPSQLNSEYLEELQPYSLVTRIDKNVFDYLGTMKFAVSVALISKNLEDAERIQITSENGGVQKSSKINPNSKAKLLEAIKSYRSISLNLARMEFGASSEPNKNVTYHEPKQHQMLGQAIFSAYSYSNKLSVEDLKNIVVIPSIEQIIRLSNANIYGTTDALEKFCGVNLIIQE
jgi:hypothetical protein